MSSSTLTAINKCVSLIPYLFHKQLSLKADILGVTIVHRQKKKVLVMFYCFLESPAHYISSNMTFYPLIIV